MRLSLWRRLYPLEAIVLIILFGGGLGILLLVPADLVVRLGLAVATFAAGGAAILQLHLEVREREWRFYRRPTIAFYLGYSITWLMLGDVRREGYLAKRYSERTKQLLLLLNLGDPSLLRKVDDLVPSRNEKTPVPDSYLELLATIGCLLTDRELTYFGFWGTRRVYHKSNGG